MFNLFKKKPILADLIPEGFVDIHSHILPGIDDGAKNIEESLELISQMKEMGFSKIIGTPHTYQGLYNNTNESIEDSFDIVKKHLKEDIIIDYSSEYMIDSTLLRRAEDKSLLTLKGNYVLVEMSFISAPIDLYKIIFQLKVNDYIPVIAHPERYMFLFNSFDEYHKLKRVGCKFQINLLSTTNFYGNDVCKICDKLLKSNLVNFVGSDIHSQKHINKMKNNVEIKNLGKLQIAINSNKIFK
jgi:tyrosine-protein phosphatase YwqE